MKLWNIFFSCQEKQPSDEDDSKKQYSIVEVYFRFFRYGNNFDRLGIFLAGILVVFSAIIQPHYLFLTGIIVEEYINVLKHRENGSAKTNIENLFNSRIYKPSILMIEAAFLTVMFLCLAGVIFSYITSRQVFKMRRKVFEKLLAQDMTWNDLNQTGNIASLLSENFAKIEDGIGEKVVFFLYDQSVFVSCLVWSLVIGWDLTLAGMLFLPFIVITIATIPKFSRILSSQASNAYGRASSIAEEVFRSIRTVVTFNGQANEIARYVKPLIEAKRINIKNNFYSGVKNALLWLFRFTGIALPWWYGFHLIAQAKHLSPGNIVYTPAILVTICTNLNVGFFHFTTGCVYLEVFGMACGAAENIFEMLDYEDKSVKNPEGEIKLQKLKGKITFDNVFFKYPSRMEVDVLKELTISVQPGETVAIVGQSGSGKSTCIQLLERLYDPCAGRICIDDVDIRDLELCWLRKKIGLVSQEAVLFADTIAENIRFGKVTATQAEIEKAAEKAHIHSFITSLPKGYETAIGERGMQLSGGQKQRIAIARVLIRKPCIMLLDEATSALDAVSEVEVQNALESVSRECTTIIVAHRLSTIKQANQIFVLFEGQLVEQGTYSELMNKKGHFYKLRKKQNKYDPLDSKGVRKPEATNIRTDLDSIQTVEVQEEHGNKDKDNLKDNKNFLIQLFSMSEPELKWIILGIIASIGVGSLLCLHSITYSDMLLYLSMENEIQLKQIVLWTCLFYACLGMMAGICYIVQSYAFAIVSENLTLRIRTKMFATILKQDMEWFDKKENGVGALCSRISSDGNAIQGATGLAAGILISYTSCSILCIGCAFFYQWRLAGALVSYLIILLTSVEVQQILTKKFIANREEKLLENSKFAMEAINNMRIVKAFGAENFFLRRYTEKLVGYISLTRKISYIKSVVLAISRPMNMFVFATSFLYSTTLVFEYGTNYAYIMRVSLLMFNGSWAFGSIVPFISNFQNGIRGVKSVQKLFEYQPKINNSRNNSEATWENGNIEYNNVSFSYPTRSEISILNDLNLSIRPGKSIALVGATGCGKTSIIQLLQRFYDPTSGMITIDNSDMKHLNLQHHRAKFGVVSQEPNLFDRTIAENIAYGDNSRIVKMEEIIQAAKKANIHNFISSLPMGYDTLVGSGGTQISGGQKQRIAIARALIGNPKILILDEATSALDNESESMVQKALDKAKEGRTCITIAHRLSTIQNADIICVIDKGKIVEMGNHEELMNMTGHYYQLNTV